MFYKFDRWSRSPEDGLVAEMYLTRIGVKLTSVSDNLETTPTGKFIKIVMMSTLELDNSIKGQRVKDCMKAGFEAGNWMWKVPFGYIRKPDKSIKIDKDNYWLIKRIFAEAGRGASSLEIAERVNDNFSESDVKFSAESIERIVKNPFYKGFMKSSFSPNFVKGNFKPIVTLKQWERANSKL
jgi:DNA invertase Pin-like site-specific DNA recombinase